jgi:hypothetical protein
MTYTKREQIVAAVAAMVATVPGASHWRSRAEAGNRSGAYSQVNGNGAIIRQAP